MGPSKHNCLVIVFIGFTMTTCIGRAWPSRFPFVICNLAYDLKMVKHGRNMCFNGPTLPSTNASSELLSV